MRSRLLLMLRNKQFGSVLFTAGAGWSSRLITASSQFVAIRLLTDAIGLDGYGAFAVITGLLAWFMLADLGFGAALQNHISNARVDGVLWHSTVRAVAKRLAGMLLAIAVVILSVSPWVGPYLLAEYREVPSGDAATAFAAFGILASCTGALSIILKVQFAEHRGYVAHIVTGISAASGLVLLAIVLASPVDHKLVWAIVTYFLPGALLPLLLLIKFYRKGESREVIEAVKIDRFLWQQSRVFFLFAVLSSMVLNVDYIILARLVSARDLLTYSILSKAFMLVSVLYSSILQAYWPVSAEAMRRGDATTVRSSIRKCMVVGVMIVLAGTFAFFLLAGRITLILAPTQHVVIPAYLILLFSIYALLRVWTDVFGILIMSAGKVGYLCRIVPLQAIVSIPLAYAGTVLFGIAGLVTGLTIGYMATVAWMMPRHVQRHLAILTGPAA